MNEVPDLEEPKELLSPDFSPEEKLTVLLDFIKRGLTLDEKLKSAAVYQFQIHLTNLYLDYYQFHLDEAKAIGKKYESVLLQLLEPIVNHLSRFANQVTPPSDDGTEYWDKACMKKTWLEVFNEMFSEIVGKLEGDPVLLLDDFIHNKNFQYLNSLDNIPKNIPAGHWWWFMHFGRDVRDEGEVLE